MADPLDTNVLIRYLVEDPETVAARFKGVYSFFDRLERGDHRALLPPLVLFQTYFVLTSYYEVPGPEVATKLLAILAFRGLRVPEKPLMRRCMELLSERSVDLVDAYLVALCEARSLRGVYSFDDGLRALGGRGQGHPPGRPAPCDHEAAPEGVPLRRVSGRTWLPSHHEPG